MATLPPPESTATLALPLPEPDLLEAALKFVQLLVNGLEEYSAVRAFALAVIVGLAPKWGKAKTAAGRRRARPVRRGRPAEVLPPSPDDVAKLVAAGADLLVEADLLDEAGYVNVGGRTDEGGPAHVGGLTFRFINLLLEGADHEKGRQAAVDYTRRVPDDGAHPLLYHAAYYDCPEIARVLVTCLDDPLAVVEGAIAGLEVAEGDVAAVLAGAVLDYAAKGIGGTGRPSPAVRGLIRKHAGGGIAGRWPVSPPANKPPAYSDIGAYYPGRTNHLTKNQTVSFAPVRYSAVAASACEDPDYSALASALSLAYAEQRAADAAALAAAIVEWVSDNTF